MKLMETYQSILNEKLVVGKKERITISINPILDINNTDQTKHIFGKPNGLWYTFGDRWINFTKMNMPDDYFGKRKFGYKVYPNLNNICVLKTTDDIINFTKKYHLPYDRYGSKSFFEDENDIDWKLVSKDYDGIEIPYYDDLELRDWWNMKGSNYSWLFPWDVPSGCIWNKNGIFKLRSI